MSLNVGQPTFYPSRGKCIYCFRGDVSLTEEHIIPLGLQGLMVFDKASCIPCAAITNRFETAVMNALKHFRGRYSINKRRPMSRKKFYWFDGTDKNGAKTRVKIPTEEIPATALFYKFGRAGILQGRPPFDPTFEWLPVPFTDPSTLKHAMEKYGWDGTMKWTFKPNEYARMLAKIGYSYAVAELGFDAFQPMCLDMILGRATNYSYLVGGSMEIKAAPDSTSDHFMGLLLAEQPPLPTLLLVTIRLFQQMGSPHHHVIVGRPETEAQVRRLKEYFANGSPIRQAFHGV